MIAMRYGNQDVSRSVNRKPVWYNFRTIMKPIRYKVSMKLEKFES